MRPNDAPGIDAGTASACIVCSVQDGAEHTDGGSTLATAANVTDPDESPTLGGYENGMTLKVLCKVTATLPDPQPASSNGTVAEVTSLGGTSTGFAYRVRSNPPCGPRRLAPLLWWETKLCAMVGLVS